MSNTHDNIIEVYNAYMKEAEAVNKKVKIAGRRARKSLMELSRLAKERRKEITEELKTE